MSTCLYFAYGSNMLTERLRVADRCPSAVVLGPAAAAGYRVAMTKRGRRDGSGKGTLVAAEGHAAHGVLYEIGLAELDALDRSEGVGFGYLRDEMLGVSLGSKSLLAHAYVAAPGHVDETLLPFDWYCALVIAGARQHGLPRDYIDALIAIPTQRDTELDRPHRRRALAILREAGFSDLADGCGE